MFMDFRDEIPPQPWVPRPAQRRLTKRQEQRLAWIVMALLLALLVAPIGGSSIIDAIYWLSR